MFYKEIDAGSWDSASEQGVGRILPISSRGLTQNDRGDFLRKTAASEKFLHEFANIKLADGEIPVHVNAVCATEWSGPNRKFDAFKEATCKGWHHTFVTEGKNYIHHRNRDPKQNYGIVKSSCYNGKMHRIELLLVSNGNKKAAEKNAGLVLPNEFLDKLEKNASVAVSMGCSIKNDTCSCCGNNARTRAEYCTEDTCKNPKTGEYHKGCKHGLGTFYKDGSVQYVENVEPRFFDISYVGVPADRAAYAYRATYLESSQNKTASVVSPVEDFIGVRQDRQHPEYRKEMLTMLGKLAAYENMCRVSDREKAAGIGIYAVPDPATIGTKLAAMPLPQKLASLRYLAEQAVILSPDNFAAAFVLEKTAGDHIRAGSANIYSNLHTRFGKTPNDSFDSMLAALDLQPNTKEASFTFSRYELDLASADCERITNKAFSGTIKIAGMNRAISDAKCLSLAEAYAVYKTAALCRFPLRKQDDGIKIAVWQTWTHLPFGA